MPALAVKPWTTQVVLSIDFYLICKKTARRYAGCFAVEFGLEDGRGGCAGVRAGATFMMR